jgi:Holliday junction resolvase-like predicted endonuclease
MTNERKLLISILKLTRTGPIEEKFIGRDAGIPAQTVNEMIRNFCRRGLIQYGNNIIEVSSSQRFNIAIQAIKSGADLERVGRFLEWIEFENIAAEAFEANNFQVRRRFRFKWAGRRWEIDVLACREPLVVCVDCKRWRRGWAKSAIVKAVEAQMERTQALAAALPLLRKEIRIVSWKKAVLVPVVLSLVSSSLRFYMRTPIVPILQLQNFVDELPAHLGILAHLNVGF